MISKKCKRVYDLKYRQENREKIKAHKKDRMIELKINGCAICGYNECDAALDFHHTNPQDKEFAISIRSMSNSGKRIASEVNKCILLCSNCHRKIEEKERNVQ